MVIVGVPPEGMGSPERVVLTQRPHRPVPMAGEAISPDFMAQLFVCGLMTSAVMAAYCNF